MLQAGWLKQLPGYLLCIIAFFIPFPFIFSSVAIIVLAIVWLPQANFREIGTKLRHHRELWPWLAYYLLHIVSYTYSTNKDKSLFDLQVKLSIIVFPIIIGTYVTNMRQLGRVFLSFAAGISVIAIFCLFRAAKVWYELDYTGLFFYHNLVNDLDANAVYMSWYSVLALSALLIFPWFQYYRRSFQIIRILLSVIILVFTILLSSRLLIAMLFFVTLPVYLYSQLKHTQIARWKVWSTATLFLVALLMVFTTKNPIKQRYDDILHKSFDKVWLTDYSQVEDSSFNNLTLRFFIWRVGFENIKQHNLVPYGAGNGDVSMLQNNKMAEYKVKNINSSDPAKKSNLQNISTHNMFLQSLMMLGLPGLLCFILMVFLPFIFVNDLKEVKYTYIIFNIISLLFMLQESALQSQAGVVFYSFFSMLFYSVKNSLTTDN